MARTEEWASALAADTATLTSFTGATVEEEHKPVVKSLHVRRREAAQHASARRTLAMKAERLAAEYAKLCAARDRATEELRNRYVETRSLLLL
jgi:hypothetical protein